MQVGIATQTFIADYLGGSNERELHHAKHTVLSRLRCSLHRGQSSRLRQYRAERVSAARVF